MRKFISVLFPVIVKSLFFLALLAVPQVSVLSSAAPAVEKSARSIDDVLRNASRRDKVVIAATVKRAFDFDTLLLSDEKSEIAVSFVGVRQGLQPGDKLIIAGRFDGRVGYHSSYGLVKAIDWAAPGTPKAAALVKEYGVTVSIESPASVSAVRPGVEPRLQELENLKSKGLITPGEYQEQRKRILDQL